jgi:gliding motility-associated-like protein
VSKYELYRKLEGNNNYVLYNTYNKPSSDTFNNGTDNYGQLYRIKAYELNGDRISWSNDIVIYYDPIMFVPNAFTPDGNGRNEVFKSECTGSKKFAMRIYSRWGEKLFETESASDGWDGTYGGKDAPEGIYVYSIDFTDFKDKLYQFSGTVHLIRSK